MLDVPNTVLPRARGADLWRTTGRHAPMCAVIATGPAMRTLSALTLLCLWTAPVLAQTPDATSTAPNPPAPTSSSSQTTRPAIPSNIGTGFVVSNQGHILTSYHVIRDKTQILVGPVGQNRWHPAQLVHVDERKDLALLRTALTRPPLVLADWSSVPIGLEAVVIGYPQPGLLGLSKKITQGLVNGDRSDSGDEGYFQFSAEIQKGNSGGPVLAPDGTVLGVVQTKLNALVVAERTRDLPQNVNHALKAGSVRQFLTGAGLAISTRPVNPQVSYRPFELYRQYEQSIVAVVGRTPPVTPSPAGPSSP